jgi:hypothetical protein
VIDTIRDGTAPPVIRRKGACGDLPVSVEEKIEILVLLSKDADETTRNAAYSTLVGWNPEELEQVLSNGATPTSVLDFVTTYLAHERRDLAVAVLQNPSLPDDLATLIREILADPANAAPPPPPASPGLVESPAALDLFEDDKKDVKKQTLLQKIGAMTPSEKIKCALTGNMEERLLLIRDSNKLVARAVLGSPKLTDQEIENIASMKNVTEEVLRLISMNRKFMRTYAVVRQLINNPRTPIDVGMSLLHRINDRDLKGLMLNKNIAEVVRGMALKMIKQKEEANKPKLPQK